MRILVCGGRDFNDYKWLKQVLDGYLKTANDPIFIVSGMARGADALAALWASENSEQVNLMGFHADWATQVKAAGPIRNQQMLTEGKPDLVIAFPGGKGTADMIRRSEKQGHTVIIFR